MVVLCSSRHFGNGGNCIDVRRVMSTICLGSCECIALIVGHETRHERDSGITHDAYRGALNANVGQTYKCTRNRGLTCNLPSSRRDTLKRSGQKQPVKCDRRDM